MLIVQMNDGSVFLGLSSVAITLLPTQYRRVIAWSYDYIIRRYAILVYVMIKHIMMMDSTEPGKRRKQPYRPRVQSSR